MRIRTAVPLSLLLVLAVAGCARGGGDEDGVATANGSAKPSASASASGGGSHDPQAEQDQMLKFAQCMRDHGVPMEDPKQEGGGFSVGIESGTDRSKVEAAQAACKQYLPNGGEPMKMDPAQQEQMRKFAQCMRDNGIPNFPDPSDEGMMIDGDKLDIDPRSDTFKKAEEKCREYAPKPPGGGEDNGPQTQQHTEGGNA